MIVNFYKCETCRYTQRDPLVACPNCQRGEHQAEIAALRAKAVDALPCFVDGYSDSLVAWCGDGRIVRVLDAGMFLRCHEPTKRDTLVADATKLRDENRELLAENARLRRALERSARPVVSSRRAVGIDRRAVGPDREPASRSPARVLGTRLARETHHLGKEGRRDVSTWLRVKRLVCDLCPRLAVWRHPLGGLRCAACPRPEPRP